MKHQFSEIPRAEIPRSSFDRSHGLKAAIEDGGTLVPIFVDEILPGDTCSLRATLFGRLATPIKPVMDNIFVETFFFFVPMRLVWDNWAKFCGAQENPGDSTDYTIPVRNTGNTDAGKLYDHMGLPINVANGYTHNVLPFRAYNLIWNEWFRDQNLQNSEVVNTDDGPDDGTTYSLLRRGKRHDYFTSCLPWPQKGTAIDVPILGNAPITGIGSQTAGDWSNQSVSVYETGQSTLTQYPINKDLATAPGLYVRGENLGQDAPAIYADLSQASGVSINSLRLSFQLQKMAERDARGGTRLTEVILSHFGVTNPDFRLQRPEFLGGGSSAMNFQAVPQTQRTDVGEDPQGNLAAFGTFAASGHGFTKSFTEHGYVIGLVNFRADLTYQQGMDRMWSRNTRYDFYWPALAHIGEQAVLNKEIFTQGTVQDDQVFGYQERFAEYRYFPSRICGKFRSASVTSLDFWHLSQDFASLPLLNASFIEDNPPIDRVVAVPSEPKFLLDAHFTYRCARPMPLYGTPGFVDRF